MLTQRSADEPALGGSLHLEIADTVVRLAFAYVAAQRGWRTCEGRACPCVRVTDHGGSWADGRRTVLVVGMDPASCRRALDAVTSGRVHAVVPADEPGLLVAGLDAVQNDLVLLPARVVHRADAAPRLSERLTRTLRLVAAGRSNREIGVALHESESTAKRDVALLLQLFDAPNRTALLAAAARLGYA